MKELKLLSIFIFFALAANSYACGDVRLDLDPQVLGKVPPGDQGKTSACFAEAAVQLIDAYRFSHGDKDTNFISSPLVLGSQSGDILNGGGEIRWALEEAAKSGTCNQQDIAKGMGTKNETEFLEFLVAKYATSKGINSGAIFNTNNINGGSSKTQNFASGDELSMDTSQHITFARDFEQEKKHTKKKDSPKTYSKDQNEAATKLCLELTQTGVSGLGLQTLLKLIDGTRTAFIKEVLTSLCAKKKELSQLPAPTIEDFWDSRSRPPSDQERIESLHKTIDDHLSVKNQPIAIEFCNEAVTSSTHEGKYNRNGEWVCQTNGGHAAVIVGSKKSLIGGCSYLVRDSYCGQYPKQPSLLNRFGGTSKSDFCTKGQYWIPADQLLKNTRAVVHY